ncbi:MAG: CoA transferase, partial [Alphaproteobacteria bacterium]|nr:CoA transferase [Alphaproteobacteria bacterium]
VPAGPLNTIAEVLSDPQTAAREMVVSKDGYRGIASPVKMSRSKASTRITPPDYGADNRAVLREAGYGDAEIEALVKAGAVVEKRA